MTYLHSDHLGSTVETTGYTTSEQLYFPYGAQRTTEEVAAEYRYTGQRWEEAIGLYDYDARWYDPELGRFIQPDTVVPEPGNPQALNRYSYGLNNPVRYVDPTGHFSEQELLGFGFTQQQIDYWKNDAAWWALLFNAKLGDEVWAYTIWGRIGGTFCAREWQEYKLGRPNPGYDGSPRLFISGYKGDLENYLENTTIGHDARWRKLFRNGQEISYATISAATIRYEDVPVYDSSLVNWTDVSLDVAGLVTLGLAERGSPASKAVAEVVNSLISGVSGGRAGVGMMEANSVSPEGVMQILLAYSDPYAQTPIAKFGVALAGLAIDLKAGFTTKKVKVYE